jgi:hypothetical protein
VIAFVAVELLLSGFGSVMPGGGATVAVLVNVLVAAASTVPVAMKVAVPVLDNVTVVLILPLPLSAPHDPFAALHVQLTALMLVGNVSITIASVTAAGPVLVITIV